MRILVLTCLVCLAVALPAAARPKQPAGCRKDAECVVVPCCCAWHVMLKGETPPPRCKVKCSCRRRAAPPAARCFSGVCAAVHAGAFRGDVKTRVFHVPACRRFLCPSCSRVFSTRDEAIKAGFRPHACAKGAPAPGKPGQPKSSSARTTR